MNKMINDKTWFILDQAYFDYAYFLIYNPEKRKSLRSEWLKILNQEHVTEKEFLNEFDKRYPIKFGFQKSPTLA
jgi:hypothetical protein